MAEIGMWLAIIISIVAAIAGLWQARASAAQVEILKSQAEETHVSQEIAMRKDIEQLEQSFETIVERMDKYEQQQTEISKNVEKIISLRKEASHEINSMRTEMQAQNRFITEQLATQAAQLGVITNRLFDVSVFVESSKKAQ